MPTSQHVRPLNAARLAVGIADVPTLIVARTDALAATTALTGSTEVEQFHQATPTPPGRRAAPPDHPATGAGATPPAPAKSSPADA
ncbi:hypothetical protein [Streptomyces sp. SCA2-2]|uniref:hypothetical protein n=1 Tax=Streptomyces sp. SCA2-2 TaxID=1563677 RepID=UPI0026C07F29